jgi:hypothetical protein rflaF_02089
MLAIYKREMKSYFSSPIGYVYMFFYLILTGLVFYYFNLYVMSSDTSSYFLYSRYILIAAIPILAIKLFPDERKNKTDQILITAPVSITRMVLGKYFAAYTVYALSLVPGIFNMIFLGMNGNLEVGTVLINYTGMLLIGAAFLAISMFMSAMTESIIVAYMLSAFVLAIFAVSDIVANTLNNSVLNKIVGIISMTDRFEQFTQGLFNSSTILYFLSVAAIFIFLIIRVIDKRRWS